MEFDISQAAQRVKEIVHSSTSTRQGLTALLDYCAKLAPNPVWAKIAKLDIDADQQGLRDWLVPLLTTSPPDQSIVAYYVGLFETALDDRETLLLYLSGSTHFDPADAYGDWTGDPAYFPEDRYALSAVLDQIYQLLVKADTAGEPGIYVLGLGYPCLVMRDLLAQLDPKLTLGARKSRVVAVGFDEGDLIILGQLTREGWRSL